MSVGKIKSWIESDGRLDITEGLAERELAVLSKVWLVARDLDAVVPHQGAKVGKGGEHHDLGFGRMLKGRKTSILFCGVLLPPKTTEGWVRRDPPPEPGHVRLYLKLSEVGVARSPWSYLSAADDAVKPDAEWRYVEIPPTVDLDGEEILDLIEDAYFEVVGI